MTPLTQRAKKFVNDAVEDYNFSVVCHGLNIDEAADFITSVSLDEPTSVQFIPQNTSVADDSAHLPQSFPITSTSVDTSLIYHSDDQRQLIETLANGPANVAQVVTESLINGPNRDLMYRIISHHRR